MEMADRIAVMERGRIVQFATPAELLEAPATPFVAGFVGEAARLPCAVRAGVVHFDPLPLPPLRVALPDGPAQAFLRPHEVVAGPGDGATLRLVRADGGGEARVVADAAGMVLDAVVHGAGAWAVRGVPCRLSLRGAVVFGAPGERARATPLVERAALRG